MLQSRRLHTPIRSAPRRRRAARTLTVLLFALLTIGLAAPSAADCDAGCFPLGPGSAEYNRCMTGCQSGSVSGGGSSGFRPPPSNTALTITGPQSLSVFVARDVWVLICNDFAVNGLSVPQITKIHYRLMDDPAYSLSAADAGRMVAYAVQNECPQYKSALLEAGRQHDAGG